MYTVSWDEQLERVGSVDELERLLDRLHERFRCGDATFVTVELEGGDVMTIGLGSELSVLNYVRGDKNPPYFTSVGGSDVDAPISFRFGGDSSEYPMRNAVTLSVARAALRRFCETATLPETVEWEEV